MDNDIILYLSKKIDIHIGIYDYLNIYKDDIHLYVKENINEIYYNIINDNNILILNIILKGNKILLDIKYNNKKQKIIISSYYEHIISDIILLDNLISLKEVNYCKDKIRLYRNESILSNSFIIMDIIKLLTYDYEIEEELELFIINNLDNIKINFKENNKAIVSKILYEMKYEKFINIIKIKNYLYEILFDIDYNELLLEMIKPKNMTELYITILYDKYFIIDDLEKIEELLKLYGLDNFEILFIKSVFQIFQILNDFTLSNKVKIGILIKKYRYLAQDIIRYSIEIYNNIFHEKYDIDKIEFLIKDELLKKFVINKDLDIPKYKNNIRKYQNIIIFVYSDLYELEYYDWELLEKLFKKYMVEMEV